MYKIDELILMTGIDIQLEHPLVKIHQPTIEEIALIGGDKMLFKSVNTFFVGSEPLHQFIDALEERTEEEKKALKESTTEYDHLLFVLSASAAREDGAGVELVNLVSTIFKLIVPTHRFIFEKEEGTMLLISEEQSDSIVVDRDLFMKFKSIVNQIFLLDKFFGVQESSVELSPAAQKIADKMAAAEKKIRESKQGGDDEDSSQFAIILSVMGLNNRMDYLNSLTIYQLYNQFERFNLFTQYDQGLKAALAGTPNVEMVDWYKKL